jgi:hypothetical protein
VTEGFIAELIKQGGFAVLCGAMFLVYRHDAKGWAQKQTETAQAFMSFGERTATALTQVSEAMRQQAVVLTQIERHLNANHLCPVTEVTSEMLRDENASDGPARRRVDALLRDALRRAAAAPDPSTA